MPTQTLDSTSLKISYPSNLNTTLFNLDEEIVLSYADEHSEKKEISGWNVAYEVGGSLSASFQKMDLEVDQKERGKQRALDLGFPLSPKKSEVVTGLTTELNLSGGFKSSQTEGVFAFSIKGDASISASCACFLIQNKDALVSDSLLAAIRDFVFPFQLPTKTQLLVGKQALLFEMNALFGLHGSVELSEILMMDRVLIEGIFPEGGAYAVNASMSVSIALGAEWSNGLRYFVSRPAKDSLRLQASRTEARELSGAAGILVAVGVKDPKKVEKGIKALFEDIYEVPDNQWDYLVQKLQSGISHDQLPEQLKKPIDKLIEKYGGEYSKLSEKLLAKITEVRDRVIEIATLQMRLEVQLAWKNLTEHAYLLDLVVADSSDVAKTLYPLFLTGQLPEAYRIAKGSAEAKINQYLEIFDQTRGDSVNVSLSLGKLFSSKRVESREVSYIRTFDHGSGTCHLLKGAFTISSESSIVNYSLCHALRAETPKIDTPTVGDLVFSASFKDSYTIGRNEFTKKGGAILDDHAVRIAKWLDAYDSGGPRGDDLRETIVRQLKQLMTQEFRLVFSLDIPDEGIRRLFRLSSNASDAKAAQEFATDLSSLYAEICRVNVNNLKEVRRSYQFVRQSLKSVADTDLKSTLSLLRSFWFDLYHEPISSINGFSVPGVIMAMCAFYCQGLPRRIDLKEGESAGNSWSFSMLAIPEGHEAPLLLV